VLAGSKLQAIVQQHGYLYGCAGRKNNHIGSVSKISFSKEEFVTFLSKKFYDTSWGFFNDKAITKNKKTKIMETAIQTITVKTTVNAGIEKVWNYFTAPQHIIKWNHASDDWHSPKAENDLRKGGKFNYRMEAKDGSFGFDFEGSYDEVKPNEKIAYTIGDGRKVEVIFLEKNNETEVITRFEAEQTNSIDMQRGGWQAILDNFKKYAEAHNA
jgi:uncharacterized protein YndB with AHSA1/START domain